MNQNQNQPALLPQIFLDEPPPPPQFQDYPFNDVNNLTDSELLQVLHRFVLGQPHGYEGIILPLDFTKYTLDRLKVSYGRAAHQAFLPIYVFHHYKGHPEKRNFDMSQKTVTEGVKRCYWKKYRRSYYIPSQNEVPDGERRLHRLSSASRYAQNEKDSWDTYKLKEYVLDPLTYIDLGAPLLHQLNENQASYWSLTRIFVDTFPRRR